MQVALPIFFALPVTIATLLLLIIIIITMNSAGTGTGTVRIRVRYRPRLPMGGSVNKRKQLNSNFILLFQIWQILLEVFFYQNYQI